MAVITKNVTLPPFINGDPQSNSNGDIIMATPVVVINPDGEYASFSGSSSTTSESTVNIDLEDTNQLLTTIDGRLQSALFSGASSLVSLINGKVATSTLQGTGNGLLSTISSKITGFQNASTLSLTSINDNLDQVLNRLTQNEDSTMPIVAIRDTTLAWDTNSSPMVVTPVPGALFPVTLPYNTTNTIGIVKTETVADKTEYQAITFNSTNWTNVPYYTSLNTCKKVFIMPQVNTPHSNSSATLQFRVQWSIGDSAEGGPGMYESYEVNLPESNGESETKIVTKYWTVPVGASSTLPFSGVFLDRKGARLRISCRLSSASSSDVSVQFECRQQH